MKKVVFILVMLITFLIPTDSSAQLLKKLKAKVENKVEKVVTPKSEKQVSSPQDNTVETKPIQSESSDNSDNQTKNETTSYTSKFDFVPGEKLVLSDDFNEDAIGDFPAAWFTNGSGEVVTVNGTEGKWLMLKDNSKYFIDKLLNLPENYTIQFDLMCSIPFEWSGSMLYFTLEDVIDISRYRAGRNGGEMSDSNFRNGEFKIDFHPGLNNGSTKSYGHYTGFNQKGNLSYGNHFLPAPGKNIIKISIWRQKDRLRMYVNENKLLDLPKILPPGLKTTVVSWSVNALSEGNYFLGNIRMAVGNPDTRNKLLNEGKLITNGILFNVNSDKIKTESFGVLKEISGILKESGNIKVMIVGHTDSDGDTAKNLELSERRSQSVKNTLVTEFGVDSSMLETSGKGESEPIIANTNNLNKALNRRVEFIKTN